MDQCSNFEIWCLDGMKSWFSCLGSRGYSTGRTNPSKSERWSKKKGKMWAE